MNDQTATASGQIQTPVQPVVPAQSEPITEEIPKVEEPVTVPEENRPISPNLADQVPAPVEPSSVPVPEPTPLTEPVPAPEPIRPDSTIPADPIPVPVEPTPAPVLEPVVPAVESIPAAPEPTPQPQTPPPVIPEPTINIEPVVSSPASVVEPRMSTEELLASRRDDLQTKIDEALKFEQNQRRQKANQARKDQRNERLNKIIQFAQSHGPVKNQDVRDLLHVSQSSVTDYLSELVNRDMLKKEGKSSATTYH